MLENDGTKLVQHILPCDISLHYLDAQCATAVCRLFLVRCAALRCGFNGRVYSVARTLIRVLHNRVIISD